MSAPILTPKEDRPWRTVAELAEIRPVTEQWIRDRLHPKHPERLQHHNFAGERVFFRKASTDSTRSASSPAGNQACRRKRDPRLSASISTRRLLR